MGARPVSALIEGSGLKELVDVEVDGETITATDGHPFWVDDEGRWVDAEDLQVGDLLLLADGTTTEVDGVRHHTQTVTVRNLTVEGIHTYHVAFGDEAALVQNCPATASTPPVDGFVDLSSPSRRAHILDGERLPNGAFNGGHRAGTGFPLKSEFPAAWSDDEVMHHISDIATDPAAAHRVTEQTCGSQEREVERTSTF